MADKEHAISGGFSGLLHYYGKQPSMSGQPERAMWVAMRHPLDRARRDNRATLSVRIGARLHAARYSGLEGIPVSLGLQRNCARLVRAFFLSATKVVSLTLSWRQSHSLDLSPYRPRTWFACSRAIYFETFAQCTRGEIADNSIIPPLRCLELRSPGSPSNPHRSRSSPADERYHGPVTMSCSSRTAFAQDSRSITTHHRQPSGNAFFSRNCLYSIRRLDGASSPNLFCARCGSI